MFRFCFAYFIPFSLINWIAPLFVIPKLDIPRLGILWPLRQITSWTAAHVLAGREVVIGTANGKLSSNACGDAWKSLTVVDINARAPVNCLMNNIVGRHVSYRDSPKGWVLLSMFDMGTCPDYSCFDTTTPSHLVSNWQSIWPLYGEELLLVKIDGTAVYRLAHHRSRSAEYYWAQPHAAISRDGRFVVWDSNFDISSTADANYADVYRMRIQ